MQASLITGFFFSSFFSSVGLIFIMGSALFTGDRLRGGCGCGLLAGLSSCFFLGGGFGLGSSFSFSSAAFFFRIFWSCAFYPLSTMGTTLAASSTGRLSSEGSLSDPPDESPSPAAMSFLSSTICFSICAEMSSGFPFSYLP